MPPLLPGKRPRLSDDGIQEVRAAASPLKGKITAKFVGATTKVWDWDDDIGDNVEYEEGDKVQYSIDGDEGTHEIGMEVQHSRGGASEGGAAAAQ